MSQVGTVYLVGAGPGDLGLVTLRARELIESCDVLVYDYLTNPDLLAWTPPQCEHIYVGKRPNFHAIPQSEIEAILLQKAQDGLSVVRLKGGDPFIFGRGGEEAERLQAAGIPFEIIPGVTAALGSAACMGIPLTHRESASSVCFITGHEDPEKQAMRVDFKKFAGVADTLCIYMGMGNLECIAGELMADGLSPETPVAVVQWATLPKQRSIISTLQQVAADKETAGLKPPAVIIVGASVRSDAALSWFERRPLFGRRVVVTRNREQAGELSGRLRHLGAEVLELPLIEVAETADNEESANVLAELHSYRWIVFTSANGVRYFFNKFFRRFSDLRDFGGMRIACIGKSTARAVEAFRLQVDFVPPEAVAEALADGLLAEETLEHETILVITGNRNRRELVERLEAGKAIVDTLPVYETNLKNLSTWAPAESFREFGADAITFTSASTVDGFAAQAQNLQLQSGARRPRTVSIGPLTSGRMRAKGMPVDAEAKPHDLDGLVQAVVEILR